jgi:hypothetical protein
MAMKKKVVFDPRAFLAKAGVGRAVAKYRKAKFSSRKAMLRTLCSIAQRDQVWSAATERACYIEGALRSGIRAEREALQRHNQ